MMTRISKNTLIQAALTALFTMTLAACAAGGRAPKPESVKATEAPEDITTADEVANEGDGERHQDDTKRPSSTPTGSKDSGVTTRADDSGPGPGTFGAGAGGSKPDDDPRRIVEGLIQGIERRSDQYREEFGIEDFSAPAAPESCDEVCDLSKAICQSSKRICEISQVQSQDSWFSERCRWSSKQCEGASTQCDTCSR